MPFVILPTNSISGGYDITNSLRFNSGSSDYLNKTSFGTATNRKKFTFSFWVKKVNNGDKMIFSAGTNSSTNVDQIYFRYPSDITQNTFDVLFYESSVTKLQLRTTQYFRDPSAWYHFVVAIDSTQATASNRAKVYLNGTEITSFSTATYPSLNDEFLINSTGAHYLGGNLGASLTFDGYMSEYYFIDGQQLTPSSFGETDTDTGIWKPKAYTGSYGTNGFYLQFKNSASLGTDSSGNGNTFTVNNLTSVDQSTDTPTNNFATMNSVSSFGTVTFAEGNNQVNVADNTDNATSTFMVSSGKWYWEGKYTVGASSLAMFGIRPEGMDYNQINLFNLTGSNQGYYYYANSGNIRPANTSYGNTFAVNDIIGIALDLDNNKLYFSKNGTFQNSGVPTSGATGTGAVSIATSGLTWGFSFTSGGDSDTFQMNFGNPPYTANGYTDGAGKGNFSYSVPSGYFALCTANLSLYG